MSGFRINTNTSAIFTNRLVGLNKTAINRSIERLASGLGINRAADDAAGLAVTERMRTQIEGLNQGTRNIQDGISLLQTAEGGLQTILDTLHRMRTLAVQASNDTLTDADRALIQLEVDQHLDEIDRQASTVSFNTKRLLDGSAQAGTVTTISSITTTTPVNENFVVAENLVNITNTNFDSEINAKVSPDGTTIVYSNNTGGGSQLETRPIGGGAPTIIATGFVENFAPEISPDGTMIAFSGFNGARTDIYTIPIGGGATTNVTNGLGVGNGFPTWAPDGARIAFGRDAGAGADLRTANADGSGAEVLIDTFIDSPFSDISPDGTKIAFGQNGNQITEEPIGGGAQTMIALGGAPRYSPDGTLMMHSRTIAGITQVLIRNADGTGPTVQLTNIAGPATFASSGDWTSDMRGFVYESDDTFFGAADIFSANTRLFQDLAQPVSSPATLAITKNGVPLALGVDYTLVDPDTIRFTTTGIPNVGDVIAVSHSVTTTTPVTVTRTNGGIVIHDGADKDQTLTLSIAASRTQDLFRSGTPDLSTRENAQTALSRIDAAISRVTGTLAEIGAQQNRLEASRGRNQIQSQNVTASRSRMRDLDFADEIIAFTRRQILDQSGISALAQANVMPQSILQLLS